MPKTLFFQTENLSLIMPTKSNLVIPDDSGADTPNSNSAFSGNLPPIADSISSLDGSMDSDFLENDLAHGTAGGEQQPKTH